MRNLWSHAIIFCGHFPDQTYMFTEDEVADESRGAWYVRQLIGAANIDGSDFFHFMSGNLSFQVEHHLYPDLPSSRYKQIAPRVKEVCEKYGLPYNTGPFRKQWGTVQRTILRLAFPGGSARPSRAGTCGRRRNCRRRGRRGSGCRPSRDRRATRAVGAGAAQPPLWASSASAGTMRESPLASQPSGSATARAPLVRPLG